MTLDAGNKLDDTQYYAKTFAGSDRWKSNGSGRYSAYHIFSNEYLVLPSYLSDLLKRKSKIKDKKSEKIILNT